MRLSSYSLRSITALLTITKDDVGPDPPAPTAVSQPAPSGRADLAHLKAVQDASAKINVCMVAANMGRSNRRYRS